MRRAEWGDNQTWVYTGLFHTASTTVSLAGDIDDNLWATVDGKAVPAAGWAFNSGILDIGLGPNGDGWHTIDIRFQNGGGGAGATGDARVPNWPANVKGFGIATPGVGNSDGNNYTYPIDPNDGTLFRAVPQNPTYAFNTNLTVSTANSEINVAVPTGSQTLSAQFGTLDVLSRNLQLTVSGSAGPGGASFTNTTMAPSFGAAGSLSLVNAGWISLGQVSDGGFGVSFNLNGAGTVILDKTDAASRLNIDGQSPATQFAIGGVGALPATLVVVGKPGDVQANPLGSAVVTLGAVAGVTNSTLAFSSKGGDFTFDTPIAVAESARLWAGPANGAGVSAPATTVLTVGGANGISVATGKTLSLSSIGNYVLDVGGDIGGTGSTVTVTGGTVRFPIANSMTGGTFGVSGGTAVVQHLGAFNFNNNAIGVTGGTLRVEPTDFDLRTLNLGASGTLLLAADQTNVALAPANVLSGTVQFGVDTTSSAYKLKLGTGSTVQASGGNRIVKTRPGSGGHGELRRQFARIT